MASPGLYHKSLLKLLGENVAFLEPNDEGKRNLVELAEFAHAFKISSAAQLEILYPDLINENIDRSQAVAMYKRFAEEALTVLDRYAGVAPLLPGRTPPTPRVTRHGRESPSQNGDKDENESWPPRN